jgi:predicted amidohydrolase YtcJ
MRKELGLIGLCLVAGCSQRSAPSPAAAQQAEAQPLPRLFTGCTFVTNDADAPEAAAILTDPSGAIVEVLTERPTDVAGYEVVELGGGLCLPGLHDAHAHLLGIGQREDQVNLLGARSAAEVRERVALFAAVHPNAAVIKGRGWDQSLFGGGAFPTAGDLEGATERPVYLSRVDGHAVWVNGALLEAAAQDLGPKDPEGGRVLRGKDGKPTGLFVDNAIDLVSKHLPAPSAADLERWLLAGAKAAADAGLVAVHDMGLATDALPILLRLDEEGRLPLRVFVYLDGSDEGALEVARAAKAQLDKAPPGRVRVQGLKLFADGAMGSRGAALLEEYSDERGHKGLLLTEPKVLAEQVRQIHVAGLQVAIHAIGDRGNRTALEAIALAQGPDKTRRHRVEHAQLLHPDDFVAFSTLGVVASMQPTHATSDMRWAEARVGKERLEGAYAWRTLLESGAPLAFGSDAPVESERVLLGLYAAITRQAPDGTPAGGWLPEQRLESAAAIRAFSSGAAYAVGLENSLGALKPGFPLELSVFSDDARPDPARWLQSRPVATVVRGELRRTQQGDG